MRRRGAARLALAGLALLATVLFVRLGLWQWQRGTAGQAQWQAFARGADTRVPLAGTSTAVPLYQRVTVTGTLDGAHQFLLDNMSFQGRPGYEVLTVLQRPGALPLVIDRGWVPFSGSRRVLPDVHLEAAGPRALTGRIASLPSPGLELGRAAPAGEWPKVTAFPDMAELSAAYGTALEPRILLLDAQDPAGYARAWRAPGMSPLRHFSYAIQWWTFAGLTVLVSGVLAWRERRRRRRP
ncbi:MAG TPA: SURF1 family protein [Steroidobacteraceae bacterium]|nr:SURF1 family protein [Steroidobacteraceae bacterium]